jgi:hypothetical protein
MLAGYPLAGYPTVVVNENHARTDQRTLADESGRKGWTATSPTPQGYVDRNSRNQVRRSAASSPGSSSVGIVIVRHEGRADRPCSLVVYHDVRKGAVPC